MDALLPNGALFKLYKKIVHIEGGPVVRVACYVVIVHCFPFYVRGGLIMYCLSVNKLIKSYRYLKCFTI